MKYEVHIAIRLSTEEQFSAVVGLVRPGGAALLAKHSDKIELHTYKDEMREGSSPEAKDLRAVELCIVASMDDNPGLFDECRAWFEEFMPAVRALGGKGIIFSEDRLEGDEKHPAAIAVSSAQEEQHMTEVERNEHYFKVTAPLGEWILAEADPRAKQLLREGLRKIVAATALPLEQVLKNDEK